jgi:hypothetical protein
MCGGGGGGDGGYGARQDQMRREQDRAISAINTIFGRGQGQPIYGTRTVDGAPVQQLIPGGGGFTEVTPERQESYVTGYNTRERDRNLAERERLYGTIRQDSEARLLDTLGQDRTRAERDVRFQLARQGLMGGSADVDQGRELLEQFQEGSLEARNASTASANDARAADENTRVNLINNIRSGMAESDAVSAAFAGLNNNATAARDSAMATNIGSFFDDISILRAQNQFRGGMDSANSRYGRGGWTSSATSGGDNGRRQG